MEKIFVSFCTLLICGAVSAASANDTLLRKQNVTAPLNGVAAGSGFQVTLVQGDALNEVVVVKIDKRLEPYLICEVKNGILHLGFKQLPDDLSNRGHWNQAPTAQVTVGRLDWLKVSSGAAFRCEGGFSTPGECEIDASSAGSIKNLQLTAESVEIELSSSGSLSKGSLTAREIEIDASSAAGMHDFNIKGAAKVDVEVSSGASVRDLTGETHDLEASASSAGTVEVSGLKANQVSARASSGGGVVCYVITKLQANASSAGAIRYKTGGKIQLQTSSSSGGSVSAIN